MPLSTMRALQHYSGLLSHIKRQFERIMPERFRKTYRLVEGEDIDLNAALEAWADLRLQVPPDDKIFWRRHRIQRDVAVAFLLDMSASTAEPIYVGGAAPDAQGKRPALRRSPSTPGDAIERPGVSPTSNASLTSPRKVRRC